MPQPLIIENLTSHFAQHNIKYWFESLSQTPWAMMLDSGNGQHPNSRFNILVADPVVKITTYGNITEISSPHQEKTSSKEDPLTIVKEQIALTLQPIDKAEQKVQLPFYGGALGVFGYDLAHQFEKLTTIAQNDIKTADMAVGIYDWAIIEDLDTKQFWFVSHNKQFEQIASLFDSSQQGNTNKPEPFEINSQWQANMDFASYQQKFNQVQEYLHSGDCYQINLAQRFTASYRGNEYQAYLALAEQNNAPFSAYIKLDDCCVLSISPERLLLLDEDDIETKPIKGTIRRSNDAIIDQANADKLRHSSKDQAENVMIVDLLRNDIGKVSVAGSVKVPALFAIESFPAVHHLVSTVTAKLEQQYHATDLLRAAFPGGSITGAPKIRAIDIIDELEPHRRSYYCGSIGYICCSGNMDTSITIRTLICKNQHIYCWAGGGLVADSNVESEYRETYDKVEKILPVLAQLNQ